MIPSKITIKDSACKTHVHVLRGKTVSAHLTSEEKAQDEAIVVEAMALKDGSKAFEIIRLRADYHHNCNVLALSEGEMIVVQNPAGKHLSNPS